ncbi:MAG: P1 family peptidase [Yoonia sp.]|nr:P1 family peptidase [Yoonia sp.]
MQNLITDIAGFQVGNAHDETLKSGVTVLTADSPFTCGVHVMGGAPGTRETDLLAPDKTVQTVDAIVLSGGSAFGLDAASGVADALRNDGRGFPVGDVTVPIVPAAILFDLLNGGDKNWSTNPYNALGRRAYADRGETTFKTGTSGAGFGATTANLKGGLGSASMMLPNGVIVGALVAVNALGSATVGDGPHFWAAPFEENGEFGNLGPSPTYPKGRPDTKGHAQNTTIGIVATNAKLTQAQCTRLATAAHDGIARALVPSHTPMDGDLIFAASHGDKDCDDLIYLGHAAATCMARAIARGIFEARSNPFETPACYARTFS